MSDRHTFRADWHDYNSGIYFVTICTCGKQRLFGWIANGEMHYSAVGNIVAKCLTDIPDHHNNVELWNHVVMPNHIHMVLYVGALDADTKNGNNNAGAIYCAPTGNTGCLKPPRHGEPRADNHFNSRLAIIVRTFKAACTRMLTVGAQYIAPATTPQPSAIRIWQRNYHEHIIRSQRALDNIMNYIDSNVAKWNSDCFNTVGAQYIAPATTSQKNTPTTSQKNTPTTPQKPPATTPPPKKTNE